MLECETKTVLAAESPLIFGLEEVDSKIQKQSVGNEQVCARKDCSAGHRRHLLGEYGVA